MQGVPDGEVAFRRVDEDGAKHACCGGGMVVGAAEAE